MQYKPNLLFACLTGFEYIDSTDFGILKLFFYINDQG